MITFKTLKWKNFLSTGNQFTSINLCTAKTNLIVGENGAGKSTILDALTFSLFGKPFRKINKPMLVNSINERDCVVEIEFESNKNKFKVVRGIKPALFEVWQNDVLLDQDSTTAEYQKYLEQTILKMNYKSFTQIVVLGSSTFVPFMRLPVASRREIIEDILDIQIFSLMNQNLKEKIKTIVDSIKEHDYQIDMIEEKIQMQKDFIDELEKRNGENIDSKKEKIDSLLLEEESFAEEKKSFIEDRVKLVDQLSEVSEYIPLNELNKLKGKMENKSLDQKNKIDFFSTNDECPTCKQKIDQSLKHTHITHFENLIKKYDEALSEISIKIQEEEQRQQQVNSLIKQIDDFNAKISLSDSSITRIQKQVKNLYTEVETLYKQSKNETEASTKLEEFKSEHEILKKKLSNIKNERECLQTAAILLKDNGIKTRIIKRYLPIMNELINDYLQNMDFYVNFTLNESFEETIKSRYRDVFSYESFSEGEKARIDIALLLTWRSIAKLKNSVDTNLLILDEIFDGSLDQSGTSDLGWILRNFDSSTNVFVISHKEGIEDKFNTTWKCEKIKNFSYVKETTYELAQEG